MKLRIETLEDRTNPAPVNIGFGTGVYTFDVAGYQFHQNNANFSTTSSAFGFSSASMTAAQQVTTKNGGLVASKLNDAFDGALSFGLAPGGNPSETTYHDADGIVDITGNILTGDPNAIGTDGKSFNGLELAQQNAVFALTPTVPVIRSTLFITNPTNAPITQELGDFNNLGSDANTTIYTTSSGDTTFDAATDRWVVTFQNYSGTTSTDVRDLEVMQGPGSVASSASTTWTGNGNDRTNWLYTVTVNPGETKAIMEFDTLTGSLPLAAGFGQQVFDSNATVQSNGLLAGLSSQQLSEVVNWDFSPPTVQSVSAPAVTNASNPSAFDFTVTYSDNTAIDTSTLDGNDVLVTGPNGYSQLASFVSVDTPGNGTPRTATYELAAAQLPGGNGWDPTDNGNYTLTLQANQVADNNNNYAAAGSIGTFNVDIKQAPAITSADTTTFSAGTAGTFTVTTTGVPTASLMETGALPSGVTFADNGDGTATLAGTAVGTEGPYTFTLTADNGFGTPATQTFTLNVDQNPAITSAATDTLTVGTAGTFSVTTTGFPISALTETGALPSGVTFVDNGNGTATLAGTPIAGTGGTYDFTITAANGNRPDATQPFTLTVGEPPTITSAAATTFTTGTNGTFSITTGHDFPTATTLTETGALPSNVTFVDNGDGTATLAGTPAAGTGGTFALTVTAANGVTHTVTVDEPPTITSADATTLAVGTAGTFTVATAHDFPAPPPSRDWRPAYRGHLP
ncbi:Fibronectin type III domain protein [Fimbriiglobus ruber]|uniref:Fibronectin type III domain protein n=1 Tax=Fimbriiglobus ruber TaxID=1908690 RepID=A0A225D1A4_9BACT|nr:Fibronectin type III domain protein [Fimbriiglobus ruber]